MSNPGSHQQFGLSDLELLQQQLMLARLQGLQKQQQHGQFSDGKPSNLPMSTLATHPGSGQFSNLGGTLFNAAGIVASSNLNWMHQSVSSSMQETNRGFSYSLGEGLMLNPSVQQPDMSLHGASATSRRGNLGQYSPMQGVSYSSEEKPIAQLPALSNSFFDDKHSVSVSHVHSMGGSFMLRQGLQDQGSVGHASIQMVNSGISSKDSSQVKPLQKVTSPPDYNRIEQPGDTFYLGEQTKLSNDSRGRATLDPLEEKILFDTEDDGWNTSCSKLAALGSAEFVNASSGKEYMNSFPCIQSGSWSALMQSAVAEASSSETGMQEELSGLSFQNTESTVGKQPLDIVSNDKQSTSDYLRASVSSVDSMRPQHSSQWPNCQQQQQLAPDLAGLSVNDCVGLNNKNFKDICQGSRSSGFSVSGMIRHDYEFNPQAVDNLEYMPSNEDVIQKDCKSTSYDHKSRSNPMAVDMLYKRAAEIYGHPNHYRGENSCDSYTSKLSQACVAQASQACLNAEDSESSARSSHKSQNQAMCVSSPGANSQQECFSHLKSTNAFPTNTNLMIKGKQNLLADSFLKASPASDMSASFDSQYTSEHDKESQPRDQGNTVQGFNVSQTESQEINVPNISVSQGAAMPDRFCFQSSMSGDLRLVNLGYGQKGQTWWTPSSFGHSISPLQGASPSESCAGKSNVYGKTAIETSNLKSERNSLEDFISSLQPVNNLVDRKVITRMADTSESIYKTVAEMSQQMSLSGFSPTQDAYHFKHASSFDCDYNSSGVLSVSQSYVKGTSQDVKPLNVWKHMPSQKDSIDLSSSFGLPPRILAMGKDSSDEQKGPVIEHVAVVKGHGSAENYFKVSSDASVYAGSYINSGLTQRSLSEKTLRAFPTCSQSLVVRNVENVNKQLDIADANMNEVGYNSAALYNLNKQCLPDVIGQQPVSRMHKLSKNHIGNQSASYSSGDNSTNVVEVSTQPSALQHMYSYKVPMLQGYSDGNVLYDRMRHLQMRAQSGHAGYVQNEYIKNRQMFPLCDSVALASIKPYENVELNGTDTHVNRADASKNSELLPGLVNQIANSEPSLPSSMPLSDRNVHLVLTRPKKRKTAMYNCLPWYKEVMTTHQGILDISAAEEEWAEATNRLIEKHVDEDEKIEEKRPIVRAKRRLIATTELMQLVFQPPPSSDLRVDARTEYEIVVYSISKLVVADACGLSNIARTDCNMPRDIGNIIGGMADRLSDKATELLHRTKELETRIERSSKDISIVDILIECQELEKIGVINHFAKYRSRVPESVGIDSASTSSGLTSVRPFLQRYVRAVPLPGKLPEGIQCLSL